MRTELSRVQSDRRHPFVDKTSVLPSAEVPGAVNATWKNKVVYGPAAPFKPSKQTLATICHQFKLHRSLGLLLNDSCAVSDTATTYNITNL
jgi:hypothetical protein